MKKQNKGFTLMFDESLLKKDIISKKIDNRSYSIFQKSLKKNSNVKITNLLNNKSVIAKVVSNKAKYPFFFNSVITQRISEDLDINIDEPYVEIVLISNNSSFVAKKTKIFKEEERIHNNAPIETVTIDNISTNSNIKKKITKDKFYIIIAEFYSKNSALLLQKRITQELTNFKSKKLYVKSGKSNKTTLLSGPYSSINLMKNDYIQLKKFGFEELDITINE